MNRVMVSNAFVDQLAHEQDSDNVKEQLHSAVRRLAEDPLANSVRVPFDQYEDVRMLRVGTHRVLFKFYPDKAQIFLLAITPERAS